MGSAEAKKKARKVADETRVDERARRETQAIVRQYALEALWPSDRSDPIQSICSRMAHDVAASFGRGVLDISLTDVDRAQQGVLALAKTFGLADVRASTIIDGIKLYQSTMPVLEIASHVYVAGSAMVGDFGPAIRKLGLNVAGAPVARATGVWLAGQVLVELYWDPAGFARRAAEAEESEEDAPLDPLFESFTLEQLRELALFMDIEALVKWSKDELRSEILEALSDSYHNKIVALWAERPSYRNILVNLCDELDVVDVPVDAGVEQLEARIAHRVFAQSVAEMSPQDLKRFERAIEASAEDGYWEGAVTSTASLAALSVGNLSGFGLYIAASSSLAALGNGLGITFAFTTYTTMSSALSFVFGPVGLTAAGLAAAFHWTRARPKEALPFVLYMAVMRARLEMESKRSPEPRHSNWWTRMKRRFSGG